jgi:very-short-patch-repair endonuclease
VVLPGRDADELEWAAFEQRGILTSRQAIDLLGEGVVRGHVRCGRWRAVCRGIVATSNGRLADDQQLWVAVLAAGTGAVLAGTTAAAEAGVRGLRREPLHVLIPAGRHVPRRRLSGLPLDMPAVLVHRATVLPQAHLQIGRPYRTTTARALVDAAAWARSDDEARVALAAGCQQRLVTPAELRDVVEALPKVRRRRLIRDTVADIEGGAQALSEIDFLRLCRRYNLPSPDLQERRQDGDGRARYLDAYWKEWGLHVEVDGAHHMDVRHWAADMRRQNEVWIAGDRILRFPAWLVRGRPGEVAAQIRAALVAAGWRPEK